MSQASNVEVEKLEALVKYLNENLINKEKIEILQLNELISNAKASLHSYGKYYKRLELEIEKIKIDLFNNVRNFC